MAEKFINCPSIEFDYVDGGWDCATVDGDYTVISIGSGQFTVEQARELRDWLNKVIP